MNQKMVLSLGAVVMMAAVFVGSLFALGGCEAAKHLQYIEIPAVDMEMLQMQYGIKPCPEELPNRVLAGAEIKGDDSLRIAVGCRP